MADLYGIYETNPLSVEQRQQHQEVTRSVDWTDPDLAKITRLRLISDPGYPEWDVSYCTGVMKDGEPVDVILPFSHLQRNHRQYGKLVRVPSLKQQIVEYAKKDGVFIKPLGIFSAISTLV